MTVQPRVLMGLNNAILSAHTTKHSFGRKESSRHSVFEKGNEKTKLEFINLTSENLAEEYLCCIIRTKNRIPEWRQNENS